MVNSEPDHHMYTQYDLEGNTVVLCMTHRNDYFWPGIRTRDRQRRNLLIVALVNDPILGYTCVLWRIHCETGELLTDYKPLILPEPPSMDVGSGFNVSPLPDLNTFYLCWCGYAAENKMFYKVFDSEGNTVVSWKLAYDYSDEDPEDIGYLDGCSDDEGNLYIIFHREKRNHTSVHTPLSAGSTTAHSGLKILPRTFPVRFSSPFLRTLLPARLLCSVRLTLPLA